ncbi:hypothetical protein KPH14_001932 [Odynerus spinipes]|uniref:Dehydrogenase n=1 Tax=Odynerus spinipes TaxID=1348599 RepID=A0AAD9S034_9HYME|nr:hypothetical protein KPH14_001932 [Odynerus spinipes]
MSKEKIAVVTGASSGIGLAVVKALLREGYVVIGLARRKSKMTSEMENVKEKEKFYPYKCDVTKTENVSEAFQWIKQNFGILHILINNAGIIVNKKFVDSNKADWEKVFAVNVMGYLDCSKHAAKIMLDANIESCIININSIEGHIIYYYPGIDFNIYPASKHASRAVTEIMQKEFNGTKIRVTSISPGLVATDIAQAANLDTAILSKFPLLLPEDIADAVVYVVGTPQRAYVSELVIRPFGEV